jgi:hypothetical protein
VCGFHHIVHLNQPFVTAAKTRRKYRELRVGVGAHWLKNKLGSTAYFKHSNISTYLLAYSFPSQRSVEKCEWGVFTTVREFHAYWRPLKFVVFYDPDEPEGYANFIGYLNKVDRNDSCV